MRSASAKNTKLVFGATLLWLGFLSVILNVWGSKQIFQRFGNALRRSSRRVPCNRFPKRWQGVKKDMLELLSALHSMAEDAGVDYSLVGGSALAYGRHNKTAVPWDDDIDVLVRNTSIPVLEESISRSSVYCSAHFWGGLKLFRCSTKTFTKYAWSYPFLDIMKRTAVVTPEEDQVFPSKLDTFEGVPARVPRDIRAFILRRYGEGALRWCKAHFWDHRLEKRVKTNNMLYPCRDVMEQCHNDVPFAPPLPFSATEVCTRISIRAKLRFPPAAMPLVKWWGYEWNEATPTEKKRFRALNCLEVLQVYKPLTLSLSDELPAVATSSAMSAEESDRLLRVTRAVVRRFESQNISYFPSFGTLLAAERNGVLVLPWDDDVDFTSRDDGGFKTQMTRGLKRLHGVTTFCFNRERGVVNQKCEYWELAPGVVLVHKQNGLKWKCAAEGTHYPSVDIWTYSTRTGKAVIPPAQMKNGHIHFWERDVGTLVTKRVRRVRFSYFSDETVAMRYPENAKRLNRLNFGNASAETCKTSFDHKEWCHGAECGYSGNEGRNIFFPCRRLNEHFHKLTHKP